MEANRTCAVKRVHVNINAPTYRRRKGPEYEARRYAQLKHYKQLVGTWRRHPEDEEARNRWMEYLENDILNKKLFGEDGKPIPTPSEQVLCHMLLEEDVTKLRVLLREFSDGGFNLGRVVDFDICYDALELLLLHDVSILMLEVLMTEGCAKPDRDHEDAWDDWECRVHSAVRCNYRYLNDFIGLLVKVGLDFKDFQLKELLTYPGSRPDILFVMMRWGASPFVIEDGREETAYDYACNYEGLADDIDVILVMQVLTSARIVRRLGYNSFMRLLNSDLLRLLKQMLFSKVEYKLMREI